LGAPRRAPWADGKEVGWHAAPASSAGRIASAYGA
jgi:hypothetical protein